MYSQHYWHVANPPWIFHRWCDTEHNTWPRKASITEPLDLQLLGWPVNIMTSSNWNIFRVTGPLFWEFTGHQKILPQRASDAGFDVFFYVSLNNRLHKQSRAGDLGRHNGNCHVTLMKEINHTWYADIMIRCWNPKPNRFHTCLKLKSVTVVNFQVSSGPVLRVW